MSYATISITSHTVYRLKVNPHIQFPHITLYSYNHPRVHPAAASCLYGNKKKSLFCLQFDNLQHPGADLGMKLPCMLKYKYNKDKEVKINGENI